MGGKGVDALGELDVDRVLGHDFALKFGRPFQGGLARGFGDLQPRVEGHAVGLDNLVAFLESGQLSFEDASPLQLLADFGFELGALGIGAGRFFPGIPQLLGQGGGIGLGEGDLGHQVGFLLV